MHPIALLREVFAWNILKLSPLGNESLPRWRSGCHGDLVVFACPANSPPYQVPGGSVEQRKVHSIKDRKGRCKR